MKNLWEEIKCSDYENYMKLNTVMQMQAMNGMIKTQFEINEAKSILIFGVAGEN